MALTPGTRLGVFELIEPIGRGGMGEVYRARDTKLDRDVAIKVLPEAFAHDAERLARFLRALIWRHRVRPCFGWDKHSNIAYRPSPDRPKTSRFSSVTPRA